MLHQLRRLKARQIIWRSRRRNLIPKSKYLPTLIRKKTTRNWRANSSIETTLKMKKKNRPHQNKNNNSHPSRTMTSPWNSIKIQKNKKWIPLIHILIATVVLQKGKTKNLSILTTAHSAWPSGNQSKKSPSKKTRHQRVSQKTLLLRFSAILRRRRKMKTIGFRSSMTWMKTRSEMILKGSPRATW